MSKNILLVDDDALLRRSLAFNLERAGYTVHSAEDGEDALSRLEQFHADLVILDIGLPGMDGLDVLRKVRNQYGIPVILLTARRRELDEILGLELGADDYVTKPFDFDVLQAHVKAVLRRATATTSPAYEKIEVGDLQIDPLAHTAHLKGQPLDLSPREFDVLFVLARNAMHLVTNQDLLAQIWGAEFEGQQQVIYVHIRWLREKIEKDPDHPTRIQTIRGLGYKYIPQEV
jgi:DNA-binding response OmpR family regulator